jgi:hypothetical protein
MYLASLANNEVHNLRLPAELTIRPSLTLCGGAGLVGEMAQSPVELSLPVGQIAVVGEIGWEHPV